MRTWSLERANAETLSRVLKRMETGDKASKERWRDRLNGYLLANDGIETVACWLDDRNWELVTATTVENKAQFELKRVLLNSTPWPDHQLAILSHEVGHILVDGRRNYVARWGRGYLATPSTVKRSNTIHRTTVLREEVEVWDVGIGLCERLGVRQDPRTLERARAGCLSAYCRWVVDREGKMRLSKQG
jgi:hypothetical protein